MVTILLYHQIATVPASADPLGLAVPPALFNDHLAYLQHTGYHCISLETLAECWRTQQSLPHKSVVITFDDGYADFYTEALPILVRYGWTATVFLVADRMGKLSQWDGQRDESASPLLTWGQVRELSAAGITFGSHTLTHPRLTQLDDVQAKFEIEQSRALIEAEIGQPVTLFSYPYGASNAQLQHMVAACGYTAACGIDRGPWHQFNLRRLNCVGRDTPSRLAFRVSGIVRLYLWLREECAAMRPVVQAKRRVHLRIRQLIRQRTEKSIHGTR